MIHTRTHAGRWARLRAPLLALAVLAGACDSAEQLATTEPAAQLDDATDPVVSTDSLAVASAAVDVTQLTPSAVLAEAALYASRSLSFGPEGLWADYTSLKSTAIPFTASTNYTDSRGIVKQISAARAKGQRLILNMTGGSHSRYKTDGRFDLSKWKAVMNLYNTREIKAAVAQGVSDGTVIMNTVMDEPSVKSWGGVMTKPLLDRMATYAKGMFPTLPAGVALRYDWRTHERFTVMDAYISQYSWWRGSVVSFRDKGMAEARRQGMKMVFALNLLDGGQLTWKYYWSCPIPLTGGRGTYAPACRMTASQVRDWGRILGPAGCGLITWRYDSGFMTNWANARALKDVAATLATIPGRSCRRS